MTASKIQATMAFWRKPRELLITNVTITMAYNDEGIGLGERVMPMIYLQVDAKQSFLALNFGKPMDFATANTKASGRLVAWAETGGLQ